MKVEAKRDVYCSDIAAFLLLETRSSHRYEVAWWGVSGLAASDWRLNHFHRS